MSLRVTTLIMSFALLSACATSQLRPVADNAPYSKMEVVSPFSWGADNIFLITINYPKGVYLPAFEDEKGFYYQAPQKLTGSDSGMGILLDGGLYIEKGKSQPEKIYFIRSALGIPAISKMEKTEDIKLIP